MRAFIVRPFGTRKGIDFDKVERALIAPALKKVGATGGTTSEIMEAGNIRIDMFQRLLVADLVIADISTNNPNVFYELGIRHSLQEKRTFMIRAKTRSPQAIAEDPAAKKDEEVPFDLKTDRYFEYDPEHPELALDALTEGLRQSLASDKKDSPVFMLLPGLKGQNREAFVPVPLSFSEELGKAEKDNDATKLILLSLEVRGAPWESAGLRQVGRSLVGINQMRASRIAWETLLKVDEMDFEANKHLGNIYQKLGDITASDQALGRALQSAVDPEEFAEIRGQLGRNKKERWVKSWSSETAEYKPVAALKSPWLVDAYEQYFMAYRQDLDSYYPGLNALGLAVIILELAAKFPDVWNGQFADDNEATQKLNEIKKKRDQVANSLQLRFDCGQGPDASEADKRDKWLLSSAGDHSLLTSPNANRAVFLYQKASSTWGAFILESVLRQIKVYSALGVLKDRADQVAAALPQRPTESVNAEIERVILFTGHRIDSAKRQKPRFPPSKETQARGAIRAVLQEQRNITEGELFGIAGGANGGDILFLEVCEELGIPTELLLALPEDKFVDSSVVNEDSSWVNRFYTLLAKHPKPPILAESREMPRWLQFKHDYGIWERNNLWLVCRAILRDPKHIMLIALWDGEPSNRPGGTEHMVNLVDELGGRVIHLNTEVLFGFNASQAS